MRQAPSSRAQLAAECWEGCAGWCGLPALASPLHLCMLPVPADPGPTAGPVLAALSSTFFVQTFLHWKSRQTFPVPACSQRNSSSPLPLHGDAQPGPGHRPACITAEDFFLNP